MVSFRDISEVRRIDRMRSDFVANASHELRTPLASLRGFIETIQGPAKNDAKAQERFLGIMLDQTTRMSRLVDDLLSLSRLELKSHIAPDQKVDLVPLLGHVRDSLVPLANDVGVEIALHLPQGKAEVLGDRDELVQVFENLIENACKYGQEGKAVDVFLKTGQGEPVEVDRRRQGAGHSGRACAASDGAILPREHRGQPLEEGHGAGPCHRQAHPDAPPGAPDRQV